MSDYAKSYKKSIAFSSRLIYNGNNKQIMLVERNKENVVSGSNVAKLQL